MIIIKNNKTNIKIIMRIIINKTFKCYSNPSWLCSPKIGHHILPVQ